MRGGCASRCHRVSVSEPLLACRTTQPTPSRFRFSTQTGSRQNSNAPPPKDRAIFVPPIGGERLQRPMMVQVFYPSRNSDEVYEPRLAFSDPTTNNRRPIKRSRLSLVGGRKKVVPLS
ncbi:unnamed protein product [Danaus chrysippus]|uniref:(African queen) hypothetical protein n=1 Tax=Danaus chrysippus TaxID=151541 RepID=A0A8J2MWG8_9NEOP|nr:unnamed protein product [Danaus chrysippus]